jgi:hypothetical protein
MSDIKKKDNSSMMMLANAIGELNVMEPPQIPNDQSWLPRKFTKSKVRDIEEMSGMMARTIQNNTLALQSKVDGAITIMTASAKLKDTFEQFEHMSKMRGYAELVEQAHVVQEQGIARKITLEGDLLEIEVKDADWNYNQKVKGGEE